MPGLFPNDWSAACSLSPRMWHGCSGLVVSASLNGISGVFFVRGSVAWRERRHPPRGFISMYV